ncbi:polynucleotide 3'-phosphatase ZDP-like isoform X1 [Nicotiana tabacum]|uniref:Polynucleotide 3'-phosphatase ZDP-like isoform X1 n=1 Tax=Nicotiana tabacum TaxID=4097 RepID=A0A1S3ZGA2_TOBAC|nr:PREDICTED: polynucleotide 3'-phosphatase ZDP-like isoform X1 [Nicotiana tabacum]
MLSISIPSFFKIPFRPKNNSNPKFLLLFVSPMASSTKVTVEYAKSGRSSCKKCDNKIPLKSVRLGLVTKHAQGFEQTKWHHIDCFPFNSDSVSSAEDITGFSSLQSKDKEALEKLINKELPALQKVSDADTDGIDRKQKETSAQVKKEESEHEESKQKRLKLSATDEGAELEIAFSTKDVKTTYKDAKLPPKWRALQTIIYLEKDDVLHASHKIAAFDFDGCLAKTSVKRVGADAWSLMHPSIPEKLQSLYNDGYKLVIFTNESNIERWKNSRQAAVDSKIGRLEQFIKLAGVPFQVFIACGLSNSKPEDPFRKPKIGMWNIMKKQFNFGISIEMDKCFYVGDAAGRQGDHSDVDIRFAQAIGLKFYVPEEFFGK